MKTCLDSVLLSEYTQTGSGSAFAELVSRYASSVYRTCFRILADPHEAEDAAQAVFIILAEKAAGLRRDGSLAAWLHGVACNVAKELVRKRVNRTRRDDTWAVSYGCTMNADEPERVDENVLSFLDKALESLSSKEREAVLLRHLMGYSEKDAAAMAGCGQSALSVRASRGVARLRDLIARNGAVLTCPALLMIMATEAGAECSQALVTSITATATTAAAGEPVRRMEEMS